MINKFYANDFSAVGVGNEKRSFAVASFKEMLDDKYCLVHMHGESYLVYSVNWDYNTAVPSSEYSLICHLVV